MRMTTVSSGRITTQALISGEPSCARTTLRPPNGTFRPEREAAADGGGADDEGAAIDLRSLVIMAVSP